MDGHRRSNFEYDVFGMMDFRGYDLAITLKRWGYDYWRRNGGVKGENRIEVQLGFHSKTCQITGARRGR